MGEWIGVVVIDPEVEAKLREKHFLTGDQVREAIALGAATRLDWVTHSVYGERLLATGFDADWRDDRLPEAHRQDRWNVGMSDRMEGLAMDDEHREALELTKEDLLRMRENGRPAGVARGPRDLNQTAKSIVDQVAARWDAPEGPPMLVVVEAGSIGVERDKSTEITHWSSEWALSPGR